MKTKAGFVKIKPEILGAAAQLALVIYFLASQFNLPIPDFIQGVLLGFSIVGNLAMLVEIRKRRDGKDHE
jgi:hypothetical protein